MKKEKSCGCIIIENNKVLLIQQLQGHWGFPKGHVEEGETEKQTAIREVKEETNLDVEIVGENRYSESYVIGKTIKKEVVYFVAKKIGSEIKPQEEEINEIKWATYEEALDQITYDNSRNILKQAKKDGVI